MLRSQRGIRRPVARLLAGTLAVLALAPAPVAAGAAATDLVLTEARIGATCWVATNAAPGADIALSLRSAKGGSKGAHAQDDAAAGPIEGCFTAPIAAGDRIDITVGESKRSVTVPRMRITAIDRGADRVALAGTPGLKVAVRIHRCDLGTALGASTDPADCDPRLTRQRQLDAEGRATLDTTAALDLRGHDLVELVHTGAAGDRFTFRRAVPVLAVRLRSAAIAGVGLPGGSASFRLLTAARVLRATASLPGSTDGAGAIFRKNGAPILAKPGNRIAGSASPNGGFTDVSFPLPAGMASVDAAADTVKGTCLAGRPWRVEAPGPVAVTGSAAPNGGFTAEVPGLDPGDEVTLRCQTAAGDIVIDVRTAS
jgi:hypothetical protein